MGNMRSAQQRLSGLWALLPEPEQPAYCLLSYGVPTIILGFLGIESTAVATFEARTHRDIVYPALFVHWAVYFMYFFVTIAIVVSVSWLDPNLPDIFGNTITGRDVNASNSTPGHSPSVTVIAIQSLSGPFAGFVNGCLIFSVLSAGNTAICRLRTCAQPVLHEQR